MLIVVSVYQVLDVDMEIPGQSDLNLGSDGGLFCSNILSRENEVLFLHSELRTFVLDVKFSADARSCLVERSV